MTRAIVTQKNKKWFENASKTADTLGWKMTAVVDLDDTLFINTDYGCGHSQARLGKFDKLQDQYPLTGIDREAFIELSKFQRRGHCVKVVTAGNYSYSKIKEIFENHGVSLAEHDYHKRDNMSDKNFDCHQKAQYIDSIPDFDENHLLFDDREENKPSRCCFYHVKPTEKFPSLTEYCLLNDLICEMSSITSPPTISDWSNLAITYTSGKNGKAPDYVKAKLCFEEALKFAPNHAGLSYNLGRCFLYLRDDIQNLSKAKACFTKAKENGHDNVNTTYHLLKIEILETKPTITADDWNSLGAAYFSGVNGKAQDYEKAKLCFEEAIKLNPNDTVASYHLGLFHQFGYGVAKDTAKAKAFYAKANANGCVITTLKLLEIFMQEKEQNERESVNIEEQEARFLVGVRLFLPRQHTQDVLDVAVSQTHAPGPGL